MFCLQRMTPSFVINPGPAKRVACIPKVQMLSCSHLDVPIHASFSLPCERNDCASRCRCTIEAQIMMCCHNCVMEKIIFNTCAWNEGEIYSICGVMHVHAHGKTGACWSHIVFALHIDVQLRMQLCTLLSSTLRRVVRMSRS